MEHVSTGKNDILLRENCTQDNLKLSLRGTFELRTTVSYLVANTGIKNVNLGRPESRKGKKKDQRAKN